MRSFVPRSVISASPSGRNARLNGCTNPRATTTTRILCCSAVSKVYGPALSVTAAMPICGWPCCAAPPSVSARTLADAKTNAFFPGLFSMLVNHRLRNEIFELALDFTIRRLHHQHADQFLARVDEEVCALRTRPPVRSVGQHRSADGVVGDDANAEAVAFARRPAWQ